MGVELQQIKEELLAMANQLFKFGIMTGLEGNYSYRIGEKVLISPAGKKLFDLKPEDFLLCDLDGTVIEGKEKPSSGLEMHRLIYNKRPEVKCVVHTHSIAATSFAIAGKAIPNSLEVLKDFAGGEIPVTKKYAPLGTQELSDEINQTLEESFGVLLKNHGVLSFGKSINHAMFVAWAIEMGAKMVINAKILGNVDIISLEDK